MEQRFRRMPRERIFELTGIQFMQLNTLYQLFSLVERKSPVLEIARTLLTMPDLFNYWLTGQIQSEFSIATTTQCYDPRQQAWSEPLLQAMGVRSQIFPPRGSSWNEAGETVPPLNEAPGLAEAVVIAPACHDTGSAVAADPAKSEDFSWVRPGTWSVHGEQRLREPVINAASLSSNFTNEGGVNSASHSPRTSRGCGLCRSKDGTKGCGRWKDSPIPS